MSRDIKFRHRSTAAQTQGLLSNILIELVRCSGLLILIPFRSYTVRRVIVHIGYRFTFCLM
jgi:hypothetical protein